MFKGKHPCYNLGIVAAENSTTTNDVPSLFPVSFFPNKPNSDDSTIRNDIVTTKSSSEALFLSKLKIKKGTTAAENNHILDNSEKLRNKCVIAKRKIRKKLYPTILNPMHTAERSCKCLDCGKKFPNDGYLVRHKYIHIEKKYLIIRSVERNLLTIFSLLHTSSFTL